jgi:hypothetical protein
MRRFAVVLLLSSLPLFAQKFTQPCDDPAFPDPKTKPIDGACDVAGNAGPDANQNTAKNNFCAKGQSQPTTFDDLIDIQNTVDSDGTIAFGDNGADDPGAQVDAQNCKEWAKANSSCLKDSSRLPARKGRRV